MELWLIHVFNELSHRFKLLILLALAQGFQESKKVSDIIHWIKEVNSSHSRFIWIINNPVILDDLAFVIDELSSSAEVNESHLVLIGEPMISNEHMSFGQVVIDQAFRVERIECIKD